MKYLKKYKVFESYDRYGYRRITENEFDDIRKENCKNWTKVKTELFRGMPDLGDYLYVDPKKGDFRSSIEDTNIHIELMSNLPSWKDYPKYERCLIGGSPGAVGAYGDAIYEVIPFDDVKIAVCPYATIWETFGGKSSGWGDDIYEVEIFLDSLEINSNWNQIGSGTIETKLKSLGKIYELDKPSWVKKDMNNFLIDCASFMVKPKEEITGEDCYNYINDYLFNPVERGIKLITYNKEFKIEDRKQFWTEGPCLLIKGKLS